MSNRIKAEGVIRQLRDAIRASEESEYAIGKGAGVDSGVLSRFMRGTRGISFATAAKLCSYLGMEFVETTQHGSQRARHKAK